MNNTQIDIKKLIRENIRNLKAYTSARNEFTGQAEVFLDANENPYGNLNRYPDPQQFAMKEILAELKGVYVDQIFVGNGSDEVIDIAFRIFCQPGKDKAICFTPSYGMYKVSADINDIELIEVPMANDFVPDPKKALEFFNEDVKLMLLCSPNNPTGNSIPKETVLELLESFNGVVIIDEAYIEFSDKESMISLINDYPNLIVSQTLSKAWGLANLRIGLAYASEDMITWFNKVKAPYNVSGSSQNEALNVLRNPGSVKQLISQIIFERDRLMEDLKGLSFVKKVFPTDANFVLIEMIDADTVYAYLCTRGVIVRNRSTLIKNCLRITIGTPEENEKLINDLNELK